MPKKKEPRFFGALFILLILIVHDRDCHALTAAPPMARNDQTALTRLCMASAGKQDGRTVMPFCLSRYDRQYNMGSTAAIVVDGLSRNSGLRAHGWIFTVIQVPFPFWKIAAGNL